MQNAKCKMQNVRWLIGLVTLGLIIAIPVISQAVPGAKVLITDNPGNKVIEVDPVTNAVVWQYGDGSTATLNYPNEAIPLTNGNILIADTYNGRVIEVKSDTKAIEWQFKPEGNFRPVDIKMCTDYSGATPTPTLLITDFGFDRVMEVTYPGGIVIRQISAWDIGSTGDYLFWEAEKRQGMGTPTYLITCRSQMGKDSVIEVQVDPSPVIRWQYGYDPSNPNGSSTLKDPRDAEWLPNGNVLITDTDNKRVIIVDRSVVPSPIVWEWKYPFITEVGTFTPYEATFIENGSLLIAGGKDDLDDNKNGMYPNSVQTQILAVDVYGGVEWAYAPETGQVMGRFVDVEEKGIINIAKIEYEDMNKKKMPKVFAGVVVPIYQPEITQVGTPTIVATKTVVNSDGMPLQGPQGPGQVLTYKIELTNTGKGTATSVVVTDRVPDGTKYVFDSDKPIDADMFSHNGGADWDNAENVEPITNLRWNLGNLAPGETKILKFSVVIQP